MLKVKIKKICETAVIPQYAKEGDAGMDLTAVSKSSDDHGNISYGTGLAFEIPEGHVGLLFPRSSICQYDLALTNCVGVIDSGYRGEVSFKFKHTQLTEFKKLTEYEIGERIGQIIIMPFPTVEIIEVDKLSETSRGEGGYGSTGKK